MLDARRANWGWGVAGLVVLSVGVMVLIGVFGFLPFWRDHGDVVNVEFLGWVGFACVALGTLFGGMAWRTGLGKGVCVVGGIMTVGLFIWVATPIGPASPVPEPPPKLLSH